MTHYAQKLANILGFDNQTVLLKQAVIRKDKHAISNIITGLKDPSSINRTFHWKTVQCPIAWLKKGTPLDFALALGDFETSDVLLTHGATFNKNSVFRAAMYILEHQDHPEIKKYIAICEKHNIDWAVGEVYHVQGNREIYYGTTEMVLLVDLKSKAFDLGLFSNTSPHQKSKIAVAHGRVVVAGPNEVILKKKVFKL